MTYEINIAGRTLLAVYEDGYRAGSNGPLMDTYRLVEDRDSAYHPYAHVSIKRSIAPVKKGVLNPAFVKAIVDRLNSIE